MLCCVIVKNDGQVLGASLIFVNKFRTEVNYDNDSISLYMKITFILCLILDDIFFATNFGISCNMKNILSLKLFTH